MKTSFLLSSKLNRATALQSVEATTEKRIGVIQGRFQPFHRGHADYFLRAKAQCDRVIIGITNPDPFVTSDNSHDLKRSLSQNNPLTFYERAELIEACMHDLKIAPEAYMIVPFPINRPTLIRHYVPAQATHYCAVFDAWGLEKVKILRDLGYEVEIILQKELYEKDISATMIRDKIINNDSSWESLVYPSVAQRIRKMELDARIAINFALNN